MVRCHILWHLIWVYTVCLGLCASILKITTVRNFLTCCSCSRVSSVRTRWWFIRFISTVNHPIALPGVGQALMSWTTVELCLGIAYWHSRYDWFLCNTNISSAVRYLGPSPLYPRYCILSEKLIHFLGRQFEIVFFFFLLKRSLH